MAIRTAPSCSAADLRAAMQLAQPGDTVTATPSTAKWTEKVEWTAPAGVHLKLDGCTIIDNYKPSQDLGHTAGPMLAITFSGAFSLSGVTLVADKDNSNYKYALVQFYGACPAFCAADFTIDMENGYYPTMNYAVPWGFEFWGQSFGVMKRWKLKLADRGGLFNLHGNGEGDDAWAAEAGFGGPNFLFAEDGEITNYGHGGSINDCYHGGKFVIRHCKLQGAGMAQTHPTGGSGRARGCRAWEAYNNTGTMGGNANSNFNAAFISSGSGVFFGNKASGTYKHLMTLHSMRFDTKTYTQTPPPNGWGQYPSVYDADGGAMDQPGRGKGDLLQGPFPTIKNMATGAGPDSPNIQPHQTIEGVWEWDNDYSPAPGSGGSKLGVYEPAVLIEGRDYFLNTPKPGYTPYTYPHPLDVPGGIPVPPIEPPIPPIDPPIPPIDPPVPPVEPPNNPPSVKIVSPTDGQIVAAKTFTIAVVGADDAGIVWTELRIKGQVVKSAATTTMTYSWNTSPYKGKGPVVISASVRDAEGTVATDQVTVTVKK